MIDLTRIRSLTDFKRHTAEYLGQLKSSGRPQVLTVNGKAEIVVQDAKAYQDLLELVERAAALEGVKRGLDDLDAGRVQPAKVALGELRREFRTRRRK